MSHNEDQFLDPIIDIQIIDSETSEEYATFTSESFVPIPPEGERLKVGKQIISTEDDEDSDERYIDLLVEDVSYNYIYSGQGEDGELVGGRYTIYIVLLVTPLTKTYNSLGEEES